MHTIPEVVIRKSGVTFIATPDLCGWIETQCGVEYWFHALDSITTTIRPDINDGVQRVELYGVPHTERVYVKPVDGGFPPQQEWALRFIRGTAWLSRLC